VTDLAIQQHPAYHEGFFDAMDGAPIWENGSSAEYRAGWRAYFAVKNLLRDGDALVRTGLFKLRLSQFSELK
jgi:hypothetical protein